MTIFFNLVLFFFIFALALTAYAAYVGAPPLLAPKKAVRRMLELAQVTSGDIVYDLGCGDGRVVIMADKEFQTKAVGFELSPFLYVVGQIKKILAYARKTKIYFRNFYLCDLSKADVITCFLTPRTMPRLQRKLEKNAKPGAKLVSYAFKAKGWKPEKIEKLKGLAPIYLYVI